MAFEDVITILAVLVERMVGESGERAGFDARTWLDHWLGEADPALGD